MVSKREDDQDNVKAADFVTFREVQERMKSDPKLRKAMDHWTQRFGGKDLHERMARDEEDANRRRLQKERKKSDSKQKERKKCDDSKEDSSAKERKKSDSKEGSRAKDKKESGDSSKKMTELERLQQHDPEQQQLNRKIKSVTDHRKLLSERMQIWSEHKVATREEAPPEEEEGSPSNNSPVQAANVVTPSYGAGASYWDQRYRRCRDPFDWLQSYEDLSTILNHIQTEIVGTKGDTDLHDQKILNVGCGNSTLTEDLYDQGFHNIVNIDISAVVIEQMKERNQEKRPWMHWLVADCTSTDFEDDAFDLVIDKGTMDTLRCMEKANDICVAFVMEVTRILKPSGVYICISFGAPNTRAFLLQETLDVRYFELPKSKEQKDPAARNYAYVCQRRPDLNAENHQPEPLSKEEDGAEVGSIGTPGQLKVVRNTTKFFSALFSKLLRLWYKLSFRRKRD